MENGIIIPVELPYSSTIPFLGIYILRIQSRISKRYLHTCVHWNIIHNIQEEAATQMSVNGWMNKNRYIHAMEYHAAIKRKSWHILQQG